jgi:hypothetical protein
MQCDNDFLPTHCIGKGASQYLLSHQYAVKLSEQRLRILPESRTSRSESDRSSLSMKSESARWYHQEKSAPVLLYEKRSGHLKTQVRLSHRITSAILRANTYNNSASTLYWRRSDSEFQCIALSLGPTSLSLVWKRACIREK